MDEFDRYFPRFVGIVLDICNLGRLQDISNQIIRIIPKIERDDCFHIAGTGELKRYRGEMIAAAAVYRRPYDFNVGKAMQNVMELFSQQDSDAKKTVLVFTDCYTTAFQHNVKICLTINDKRGFENRFCICGIGGGYDKSLEKLCEGQVEFIHLNDCSNFSQIVMERYNDK